MATTTTEDQAMQALRCGELTPFYREVVLRKMAALENEVTREMVRAQEEK